MAKGIAPPGGPASAGVSEAAFQALADALEDGVFLTDPRGRCVAVNASFARWFGRAPAEILGRTAFDLWPPGVAAEDARDEERVLGGERVEREGPRPCGAEMRHLRVVRLPARGGDGAVVGVLALFRDLTGEPITGAGRRLEQGLELVGRLAGGAAHDLSNLMTVLVGNTALLAETAPPEWPHRDTLAAVEDAAAHAAALTQNLLALLRNEPRDPEPTDLNAAVEQAARLLRRTLDARIQIIVRPEAALPAVEAVPTQLLQLLLNLCLNARDAMPNGGRLELETGMEFLDAEQARQQPQRRPGAFARLRVADSGEGMSATVRARLFEPAFTTKPPGRGTGLGLCIVQSIVRDHRGWIECVSAPGRGTRFDVFLPFHPDPPIRVTAED
jgi:PAS domain S-box-containing protein